MNYRCKTCRLTLSLYDYLNRIDDECECGGRFEPIQPKSDLEEFLDREGEKADQKRDLEI